MILSKSPKFLPMTPLIVLIAVDADANIASQNSAVI